MDFVNVLVDYFSMFKSCELNGENNKNNLKEIDKILDALKNLKDRKEKVQYITDFKLVEEMTKKYDINSVLPIYMQETYKINNLEEISNLNVPVYIKDLINNSNKGIDNILYDVMLNINRYNIYLMNKKVKSQNLPITADINFDSLDVKLKDILNYLEVKDGDLDKELLNDLSKTCDFNKFKELAIAIKTDNGMKRVLFEKIEDKNVLVAILLHSNLGIINNIVNIFESENANINKVVSNIPSIFIKDLNSSKCRYNCISANYNNFVNNYMLLKNNDIDFKKMLNFSVFFINESEANKSLIDRLNSLEAQV